MKKILTLALLLFFIMPHPAGAATVTFLTSGTSFSTPSDWTTTNTIECIGAGYRGDNAGIVLGGSGGGGGAYAMISNLSISGSISYVVAAESSLGDTYFNGAASTTASISCAAGRAPSGGSGGVGGKTADSTGTVEFAGGNGAGNAGGAGGGGGGAAGLNGAGGSASGDQGGNGDAGFGGAGGSSGTGGAIGTEWNYGTVAGSGGGGGGAIASPGANGGAGGFYGAGGGGGGVDASEPGTSGAGSQGIIIISYFPALSSMIKIFGGKTLIQGGQVRIY
jgi:hypothetical protein